MRLALVHDWLTGRRGGERVLEALLDLWPQADLYTLVHVKGRVPRADEVRKIKTSCLQAIGGRGANFQWALPLFDSAMAAMRLRDYDLVLSISHCAAKSIRPPPGVPHLCYCLTPPRYLWDLFDDYASSTLGPFALRVLEPLLRPLRDRWRQADRARAQAVTRFVAISELVRERIRRCYGRKAGLVYPPVETSAFAAAAKPLSAKASQSYKNADVLMVSALRPNKNLELAAKACALLDLSLTIIGEGSARARRALEQLGGPRLTILGEVSDQEVRRRVAAARLFLHPAVEDFGIAPVEAMAAGRPVIGLRSSGLAETVIDLRDASRAGQAERATGVLFDEPTVPSLLGALRTFIANEDTFQPAAAQARAADFDRRRFEQGIRHEVEALLRSRA